MVSFRNHENTSMSFGSGITIIWGENGSGKTSILEAIHTLCFGISFRTYNKKELIKEGSNNFLLEGFFKNQKGVKNTIFHSQDTQGNKKIKVNNKEIKKRKELLGLNNVVVCFHQKKNQLQKEGQTTEGVSLIKCFPLFPKTI